MKNDYLCENLLLNYNKEEISNIYKNEILKIRININIYKIMKFFHNHQN